MINTRVGNVPTLIVEIKMNYRQIYNDIINCAKMRILDPALHYDKHHILPKSMGGTDDSSNLVSLTDREHFIAHTLLWKIHRNRAMTSTLWIMSQNKRYHYKEMNSNRYAGLREEFTGTRTQFDKQYFNRSFKVVNNIRLANGWKLKGSVPKRISKNKIAQSQSLTNKGIK